MSLGPFDPLAITAGMLTNFGYDVLKYRAQSLDGTLVGKMLKWAGIIEPNFEERVRETINKSSVLLLKEFPQYNISAVTDFFEDPLVAHQIGNYILDGRSINFVELQVAFEKHLANARALSRAAFLHKGLTSQQVITDFINCYRRILREQL